MEKLKAPLISVVVSVYNGEKHLCECIESVLNQDYTNIELIIVDDGSRDNSSRIIDDYAQKDSRIVAIHKKNSGVSDSRNSALDIAKGMYITLLDQDDVLDKSAIRYFYQLIKKYGVEIALTSQPKKFFGKVPVSEVFTDEVHVFSGLEMAKRMLYHKIVIAPWNKLISRKLIDENNIRFDRRFLTERVLLFP